MVKEDPRKATKENQTRSRISSYIRLALSLPVAEVADRVQRLLLGQLSRRWAERRTTYLPEVPFESASLFSYARPLSSECLQPHAGMILSLSRLYLDHKFNLLGSGWVCVRHGMTCAGVENFRYQSEPALLGDLTGARPADRISAANRIESTRIRNLIGKDYQPIDWHLDFKSGYRWREDCYYKAIRYGDKAGADIKVPWELARMQHLTVLAWAHALTAGEGKGELPAGDSGPAGVQAGDVYAKEFRSQIVDFIASNPPGFGVNWACTMDVAIRAANWLLAYDLFLAYGVRFDAEFRSVFVRSIYEHGLHVVNNLEFSRGIRGNHYLANVVGLLFISAYLPLHAQTDAWLAFAVQELISETAHQFLPDGLNFEASVPYHRLSLEMVIYGTAIVLGLGPEKFAALREYDHRLLRVNPPLKQGPILLHELRGAGGKSPLPPDYLLRLEKSAQATLNVLRDDGSAPQIGDNDNGRMFKVLPAYRVTTYAAAKELYKNLPDSGDVDGETEYLDEDHLDHRHLPAAFRGLYGADFPAEQERASFETELVRGLARGSVLKWKGLSGTPRRSPLGESPGEPRSAEGRHESAPGSPVHPIVPERSSLLDGLTSNAHADFGLYIFRSHRLHLSVRCGPNGQGGRGGHAHNDQLSLEVSIDLAPILVDSGTYCYTGLVERRNLFRSTAMHNTLVLDEQEQNQWLEGRPGVFRLPDRSRAEAEHVGQNTFVGRHFGYFPHHRRSITIRDYEIEGIDELDAPGVKRVMFHLGPKVTITAGKSEDRIVTGCGDLSISFSGGPGTWRVVEGYYSPGYGVLIGNQVLCLESEAGLLKWSLSLNQGAHVDPLIAHR